HDVAAPHRAVLELGLEGPGRAGDELAALGGAGDEEQARAGVDQLGDLPGPPLGAILDEERVALSAAAELADHLVAAMAPPALEERQSGRGEAEHPRRDGERRWPGHGDTGTGSARATGPSSRVSSWRPSTQVHAWRGPTCIGYRAPAGTR